MPIGTKLFPLRLFAPNGTASFPLCNFSLLNELRFCKKNAKKRRASFFNFQHERWEFRPFGYRVTNIELYSLRFNRIQYSTIIYPCQYQK